MIHQNGAMMDWQRHDSIKQGGSDSFLTSRSGDINHFKPSNRQQLLSASKLLGGETEQSSFCLNARRPPHDDLVGSVNNDQGVISDGDDEGEDNCTFRLFQDGDHQKQPAENNEIVTVARNTGFIKS